MRQRIVAEDDPAVRYEPFAEGVHSQWRATRAALIRRDDPDMPVQRALGHALANQPSLNPMTNQHRHAHVVCILDEDSFEGKQEEICRQRVVRPMLSIPQQKMEEGVARLIDPIRVRRPVAGQWTAPEALMPRLLLPRSGCCCNSFCCCC